MGAHAPQRNHKGCHYVRTTTKAKSPRVRQDGAGLILRPMRLSAQAMLSVSAPASSGLFPSAIARV